MDMKVRGIAVHSRGPASGLPVLFVHGFPFSYRMWEPQLLALPNSCHAIAYDIRGHGESDVGDGQYTIEFFVDDLIAILDYLEIESCIACGLSMGGYIVLRAVERHPERFRGLVLCDTKSTADTNEVKIKRAASMKQVQEAGINVFAREFVKTAFTRTTLTSKPEIIEMAMKLIQANTPVGIRGTLLALAARTDTTEGLKNIHVPTLLLVGQQDHLTPVSATEEMYRALPNVVMHIIPRAAHLSNLENPSAFNKRLLDFLKEFRHSV